MGKKGFRDLMVWQKAKDLAVIIYQITNSIASNIAEGDERDTDKDSVRFFYIAKGSLAELRTQIEIAFNIGYLPEEDYQKIEMNCEDLAKMLGQLIKARQKTYSP